MTRCAPMLGLLACLLLPVAAAAQPVVRAFPASALRGVLLVTQAPEVLLNGRAERLSPGARIRGTDNMLQTPASLAGHKLLVHYTRESAGLIHDVWLLTQAEADRKPWPTTADEAQRWQFSPAAQTWTRR